MRRAFGFTLVELMVVVAIIGILGAIAYPSYQNYVREARRTDGKAAVLAMADQQEKFFLANNGYASKTSDIWDIKSGADFVSVEGFYTVNVTTGTNTAYTVTATANPGQAQINDTDCRTFTITQTGAKTAVDSGGADNTGVCW